MALKFTTNHLEDSLSLFRYYKKLGEGAMAQVSDEQLLAVLDPEMNSIANLMLHLSGNVGQWVVSSVVNAPSNRNRPAEFAQRDPIPREQLRATLREAVNRATTAIESIKTSQELLQARRIQGNDTNLLTAIFHAASHFEGHTQEIIGMTRQILGEKYSYLWKPQSPEQVSAK